MNMMKIEEIVGDIILIVLNNHDPLQKIGITQDRIFVQVKGYDENGIWIHHQGFNVPKPSKKGKEKTNKVDASILIPWTFIVSLVHFPGAEGFDLPSPFDLEIGFK